MSLGHKVNENTVLCVYPSLVYRLKQQNPKNNSYLCMVFVLTEVRALDHTEVTLASEWTPGCFRPNRAGVHCNIWNIGPARSWLILHHEV